MLLLWDCNFVEMIGVEPEWVSFVFRIELHNLKDSERILILITVIIWAIWKVRNKNSINNHEVTVIETNETLKDFISDMVRKRRVSWKAIGGRSMR